MQRQRGELVPIGEVVGLVRPDAPIRVSGFADPGFALKLDCGSETFL